MTFKTGVNQYCITTASSKNFEFHIKKQVYVLYEIGIEQLDKGWGVNVVEGRRKTSLLTDRMICLGNLRQSTEIPLERQSNSSKGANHTMNRPKTNSVSCKPDCAGIRLSCQTLEFLSKVCHLLGNLRQVA